MSFRVYPTRMGEGQHPSSASHELRLVPTDLRISDSDSDKARLKFESSAGTCGRRKEGQFFSIVADRKYLLAGGVWGQRLLRLLRVRAQRFFGNQRRFSVMLAFEDPHFAEAGISFDGQQTQLISRFEQQQSFFRDHH